jgi:hypothetical protein
LQSRIRHGVVIQDSATVVAPSGNRRSEEGRGLSSERRNTGAGADWAAAVCTVAA